MSRSYKKFPHVTSTDRTYKKYANRVVRRFGKNGFIPNQMDEETALEIPSGNGYRRLTGMTYDIRDFISVEYGSKKKLQSNYQEAVRRGEMNRWVSVTKKVPIDEYEKEFGPYRSARWEFDDTEGFSMRRVEYRPEFVNKVVGQRYVGQVRCWPVTDEREWHRAISK